MSDISHDPTRGWLLLTPDGQIEIAKEDWDTVVKFIPDDQLSFYGTSPIQDHHPYSVDAEFEVVEQWSLKGENDWYSDEDDRFDLHHPDDCDYRQIARLVKAKEVFPIGTRSDRDWPDDFPHENGMYQNKCCRCNQMFYGHKRRVVCKTCYWNPTDSVTSDGTMITPTKSPRGQCNCTPEEQHGETSVMCCNRCGKPTEDFWSKPPESQDELWEELLRTTITLRKKSKTDETDKYLFDIEEAKKRYRIERI